MTELCGILNLHKPLGCTSRDAVNRLQRLLRRVKIGHAGTLDPMASGVLVICLGPCTRLIRLVQQMPKTYQAEFHLGRTSRTDDNEGEVVEQEDAVIPDQAAIAAQLAAMTGLVQQRPPDFSAVHVDGKRAYDLARRGEQVELESREVRIDRIEILDYVAPKLRVKVECGSGVYIRSIARDLGEAMGCGALMSQLTRTAIGGFQLEASTPLDDFKSVDDIIKALLPPRIATNALPVVELNEKQLTALSHGQKISMEAVEGQEYAVLDSQGELRSVGIGLPEQKLRASLNLPR